MEFNNGDDFFEVRMASILTDYDRQVMTSLYQPIIGYGALSLFFTLWSHHEHQIVDVLTHDYLFNLSQMTPHQFNHAKKHLEAMGLLRTYFKKEASIRHFMNSMPQNCRTTFLRTFFLLVYLPKTSVKRICGALPKLFEPIEAWKTMKNKPLHLMKSTTLI